jgi:hypothetical protein
MIALYLVHISWFAFVVAKNIRFLQGVSIPQTAGIKAQQPAYPQHFPYTLLVFRLCESLASRTRKEIRRLGEAEKAGLHSDEDVANMVMEMRSEEKKIQHGEIGNNGKGGLHDAQK